MHAWMRVMCAVLVTGLSAVLADSASATKILFHGRETSPVRGDVFAVAHLKSIHGDENVTAKVVSTTTFVPNAVMMRPKFRTSSTLIFSTCKSY